MIRMRTDEPNHTVEKVVGLLFGLTAASHLALWWIDRDMAKHAARRASLRGEA